MSGAAANSRALRLDQVKHQLHGDRRIRRGAAGAQHLQTGGDGLWVRRGNHMAFGPGQVMALAAGAVFGLPLLRARIGTASGSTSSPAAMIMARAVSWSLSRLSALRNGEPEEEQSDDLYELDEDDE